MSTLKREDPTRVKGESYMIDDKTIWKIRYCFHTLGSSPSRVCHGGCTRIYKGSSSMALPTDMSDAHMEADDNPVEESAFLCHLD